MALKTYARHLSACETLLRVDNKTALAYVNKMGGIQLLHFNEQVRQIWIFASYIPSKGNTDADRESRLNNVGTEWEFNDSICEQNTYSFGNPDIYLFASRINKTCDRYCLWHNEPECVEVDAFTIDWGTIYSFYAFPPFALILSMLRKIIAHGAREIVIVPNWAAQAWYLLFKSLIF